MCVLLTGTVREDRGGHSNRKIKELPGRRKQGRRRSRERGEGREAQVGGGHQGREGPVKGEGSETGGWERKEGDEVEGK